MRPVTVREEAGVSMSEGGAGWRLYATDGGKGSHQLVEAVRASPDMSDIEALRLRELMGRGTVVLDEVPHGPLRIAELLRRGGDSRPGALTLRPAPEQPGLVLPAGHHRATWEDGGDDRAGIRPPDRGAVVVRIAERDDRIGLSDALREPDDAVDLSPNAGPARAGGLAIHETAAWVPKGLLVDTPLRSPEMVEEDAVTEPGKGQPLAFSLDDAGDALHGLLGGSRVAGASPSILNGVVRINSAALKSPSRTICRCSASMGPTRVTPER